MGQPPDAPAGLRSDESPDQAVSYDGEYVISWDSAERAVKYALIESVDGTETRCIVDAPALSCSFTGRVYGKTYSYRAAACLSSGQADDSSCVEQTEPALTVEVKPAAVQNLGTAAAPGRDGSYTLNWDSLAAVSGYTLTYKVQEIQKAAGVWPGLVQPGRI